MYFFLKMMIKIFSQLKWLPRRPLSHQRNSRTMPNTDTSFEMDAVHPLFPNADPAYRTPRGPQATVRAHATTHQVEFDNSHAEDGDSTGGIPPPRQAAQGSRPSNLDSARAQFWQVPPTRHSYPAPSNAPLPRFGNMRQHMDDSLQMGPLDDNGHYDDDDAIIPSKC